MDNQTGSSKRWLIVLGFSVAVVTLVVIAGLSVWQDDVADSKRDDAQAHAARAVLLEEAGVDGQAAAEGLQAYVETGNEALLPEIQQRTDAGVEKLTAALAQEGAADISGLLSAASDLVDGSSQVITLRQRGDVAGSAAALQQMSDGFEQLIATQETAIDTERAAAVSTLSDADSAEDLSAWLGLASVVIAVATGAGLLIALSRVVLRRRVPGAASPSQ
jgi:CHASE3 domain sensor protein